MGDLISVRVLFFGMLADMIDNSEFSVEVKKSSSVEDLYSEVSAQSQLPRLAQNPNIKVAINQELVDWNTSLKAGDELAFLPPVTGG